LKNIKNLLKNIESIKKTKNKSQRFRRKNSVNARRSYSQRNISEIGDLRRKQAFVEKLMIVGSPAFKNLP